MPKLCSLGCFVCLVIVNSPDRRNYVSRWSALLSLGKSFFQIWHLTQGWTNLIFVVKGHWQLTQVTKHLFLTLTHQFIHWILIKLDKNVWTVEGIEFYWGVKGRVKGSKDACLWCHSDLQISLFCNNSKQHGDIETIFHIWSDAEPVSFINTLAHQTTFVWNYFRKTWLGEACTCCVFVLAEQ